MLREILALLDSGRARTPGALALELGLSRAELDGMLEQLCSLGYVEELTSPAASSCADESPKACAGCSGCGASGCFPGAKIRLWALAPKGRASLASEARAGLE